MDLKGQRVIEADTYLSSPCFISRVTKTELAPIEQDSNKFRKVLQEFPALLQPPFSSDAVKHGVQHHVCTTGLQIIPYQIHNSTLLCDVSTGLPRPLVPRSFQRQVFKTIHNLAHPSRKSTVKLVSQKFVWHGLKKQVSQWTQECLACQKSKIQSHVHSPVINIPVPSKRFSHLPASESFSHLLTIIDRTTRWPEEPHP